VAAAPRAYGDAARTDTDGDIGIPPIATGPFVSVATNLNVDLSHLEACRLGRDDPDA
jgi:hypothetical protein